MDPTFRLMSFSLDSELDFYLKNDFYSLKINLESPLIFVLFLKGKQNKKEKPEVWLIILEKIVCEKLDRARGSGYLSGRYGMNRSTPLSPWNQVSTNRMKLTRQSMTKSMDTHLNHAQRRKQSMYKEWTKYEWMRT